MATLTISEIGALWQSPQGDWVGAPVVPALVEQTLSIGPAAVSSAPFQGATRFLILHADAQCSIAIGAAPVAAAGLHALGPGDTRLYAVAPGQMLSVIAVSYADGGLGTLGTSQDRGVLGDVPGTVTAQLRGINAQLAAINAALGILVDLQTDTLSQLRFPG